ncbi:MAG: response regulator [Syntrophaceae bacterium]|nr:response regulator [Syntrophaceae bacterium]
MGQTNILVVDDVRSMRVTLGGILEDKGHRVVMVENGYEAIEAVKRDSFDLIFIDIKMPGINGVQTFREIKKIDRKAVVIMMTAYSVEDLLKEALEEGAYATVYKPFDVDRIIAIIEEVLREKTLILVVDDKFSDRETLKTILEDKGYRVATATDGNEAIEKVKTRHYDIIFLDVVLPGIDGVETFERVKKIDPRATVIMMTGYTVEDLVRRAVSEGAYTCIYKPFNMEKLIELVEGISREKKR